MNFPLHYSFFSNLCFSSCFLFATLKLINNGLNMVGYGWWNAKIDHLSSFVDPKLYHITKTFFIITLNWPLFDKVVKDAYFLLKIFFSFSRQMSTFENNDLYLHSRFSYIPCHYLAHIRVTNLQMFNSVILKSTCKNGSL